MMMSPLSADDNAMILETLLRCGQQARQAATQSFEVYEKGREDYVTNVDQNLDRYLAEFFAARFPHDGIVTEENPISAAEFLAQHTRLWCIDPIDGTEDFINRGKNYSVMVGLLTHHHPQAGWVHAPAQARMYWGGPRWGLFQQDGQGRLMTFDPCVPSVEKSSVILLGDRDQHHFGAAIHQVLPDLKFNALGSFGLKVLEVIKGQASLYVYLNGRVKLWDTVGPLALAEAAGLVCCDLDGQPICFDANSIYPHTLIHRQPIIVGWAEPLQEFLPAIRQAVSAVRCQELGLGQALACE